MKIRSWFKDFWVGVVMNEHNLFVDRTLTLAGSQEWIDGTKWFFGSLYKFREAKVAKITFWWVLSKMNMSEQVT